jgi:hypothetical protein
MLQLMKQTGAVTSISNFKDPDKMNWIISSSDGSVSWQKQNQDWGLGKYRSSDRTVYIDGKYHNKVILPVISSSFFITQNLWTLK